MSLEIRLRLALDRFDLVVDADLGAHVTGLFGPSGSGKTSLIECIAGLRQGATGSLRFGGAAWLDSERSLHLPPERRRVGYVPQDGLLFPHINVRENLLSGAHRERRSASDTRLAEVSSVLELEPLWQRMPLTLSGGERQRVALGRALCSAPDLLLLDEPLGALDVALKRRLLPFLRRVREQFAVPMLLVSHSPMEILALCDEVLGFRDGSVVARGRPEEVLMSSLMGDELGLPSSELESMLPCDVISADPSHVLVELAAGVRLHCRGHRDAVALGSTDKQSLVAIAARDVILAQVRPEKISARNVLRGRVHQLHPGGVVEVQLLGDTGNAGGNSAAPGDAPRGLLVELSQGAIRDLELGPGIAVFVVIKSSACSVLPSRS